MSFISTAYAMGAQPAGGEGNVFAQFFPLIAIFAVFYFLLIRPNQKKEKARREMLASMRRGDRVITAGGMYGRIIDIDGDTIEVDLGDTKVTMNRAYLSVVVDKKEAQAAPAMKRDKKGKKDKDVVKETAKETEAAPAEEAKSKDSSVVSGNDDDKPAVQ